MLKTEELRGFSVEELQDKVTNLKKALMQFRFQLKTGKLERQSSLKETKQDIARLLTIINEKKKGEKKT
jgi:large subunit ribosomal protein L29